MPDLFVVFAKKWKFILGLSLLAAAIALVAALLSPKKYLSTATALPANSLVADKARMFNPNIEILYSDFGTPDDLDRMEGTGALDTIFIAAAKDFSLAQHYGLDAAGEGRYKAAMQLKKNSTIARSGYGELKVKVWDGDRHLAADLANALLQKIQELHQHLQQDRNVMVLRKIEEDEKKKEEQFRLLADTLTRLSGPAADIIEVRRAALLEQLQQYEKMIGQYRLSLDANPQSLLTVEPARAALWPDRPKVLYTVLFALAAAFVFAFLAAVFIESRKLAS